MTDAATLARCQSRAHTWEEAGSAQRCCHPNWERVMRFRYGTPRWKFVEVKHGS